MSNGRRLVLSAIGFVVALSLVPAAWATSGEGAAAEPASVPALSLGLGEGLEADAEGSLQPAVPSTGAAKITWKRISDKTAFGTMRKIVAEGWAAGCGGTVVVATSANFPDALAASGVAGVYGAPVLVTEPKALTAETRAELARIKPTRVIVAGGRYAVSDSVLAQIRSALSAGASGSTGSSNAQAAVQRLKGATASGTAAALNRDAYGARKATTAILATSLAFQDALSAAPVAYAKKYPVFLTDGMDSISSETISAMKACGVKRVIVVGGKYAVSDKVVSRLASNGISLQARLKGATAYDTSNAIATYAVGTLGMKAARTGAATGKSYTDALCGAALCGKRNSPLVLVDAYQYACVSGFVKSYASSISPGYIFGGRFAVSDAVAGFLQDPSVMPDVAAKKAYASFLSKKIVSQTEFYADQFALVDLDDDGVAELVTLSSGAGRMFYSQIFMYQNGKVVNVHWTSSHTFYANKVVQSYFNGGSASTRVTRNYVFDGTKFVQTTKKPSSMLNVVFYDNTTNNRSVVLLGSPIGSYGVKSGSAYRFADIKAGNANSLTIRIGTVNTQSTTMDVTDWITVPLSGGKGSYSAIGIIRRGTFKGTIAVGSSTVTLTPSGGSAFTLNRVSNEPNYIDNIPWS